MPGLGEERLTARGFDNLAGVHHRHAVRHFRDHRQIVGNEQYRHATAFLQLTQQVEDLRLYRHVERGGRLVRDQQFRIAGERHGDHHALFHAARELERIFVAPPFGIGNAHRVEQFEHAPVQCRAFQIGVAFQCFGNLCAGGHHRIEREHGFLENHRDAAPAHVAHPGLGQCQQVLAVERDRTADDLPGIGQQPHHRQRGDRFAAARFAEQREGFAAFYGERQTVDRAHDRPAGIDPGAQILDFQQGTVGAHSIEGVVRGSWFVARGSWFVIGDSP